MAVKRAVEIETPTGSIKVDPTKEGEFAITIMPLPDAIPATTTLNHAELAELHADIAQLLDIKTRKRTATAAPKAPTGQGRTAGTKPPTSEKKPNAKELEKGATANE